MNEYQEEARKTAIYPKAMAITYPMLGLAGEVGELANCIKKIYRDHEGSLERSRYKGKLKDELGDVCWYVANLAFDLGLDLDEILADNLKKLKGRQKQGTLQGDGDKR